MRKMSHGKDLTVVVEESAVLLYFKRIFSGETSLKRKHYSRDMKKCEVRQRYVEKGDCQEQGGQ